MVLYNYLKIINLILCIALLIAQLKCYVTAQGGTGHLAENNMVERGITSKKLTMLCKS